MENLKKDIINYYDLSEKFDQVYLEDSFVEKVIEESHQIQFLMELVIRKNHPKYRPPKPDEFAFFLKGKITFPNVKHAMWYEKDFKPSVDAEGLVDIGNIDTFFYTPNGTYLDYKRQDIDEQPSLPKGFTYLAGERRPVPQGYYYLSGEWGAIAIQSDPPMLEIYDEQS